MCESADRNQVDVWDHEGNVVRTLWSATAAQAAELQAEYEDDPFHTVVVDGRV